MAAIITSPIPEQTFELFRDQLALVISEEMASQWANMSSTNNQAVNVIDFFAPVAAGATNNYSPFIGQIW